MSSVLRACLAPVVLVVVAVGVAGCNGTIAAIEPALRAGTSTEEEAKPDGRRMIGKPYRIGGRWYHPEVDEDYDEKGIASWYGPGFHGKQTANGERYDQYALTAAHPTLPLPSYVRVTVLDTGKSAVLRLNDRGPFKPGRIIDVSKGAAKKLGFKNHGTTRVRVEYLGEAPVGGSDRETLMAAAKFGERSSDAEDSRRGFWPFGRDGGDDDSDERPAETRVASAEQARGSATAPAMRAASAPARTRQAAAPPATAAGPVTAAAFRSEEPPSEETGAIDALIALNAEPAAASSTSPAPAAPLPAAEVSAAEERIMGAHDLFAAIDDASGGGGELRGAGQNE